MTIWSYKRWKICDHNQIWASATSFNRVADNDNEQKKNDYNNNHRSTFRPYDHCLESRVSRLASHISMLFWAPFLSHWLNEFSVISVIGNRGLIGSVSLICINIKFFFFLLYVSYFLLLEIQLLTEHCHFIVANNVRDGATKVLLRLKFLCHFETLDISVHIICAGGWWRVYCVWYVSFFYVEFLVPFCFSPYSMRIV